MSEEFNSIVRCTTPLQFVNLYLTYYKQELEYRKQKHEECKAIVAHLENIISIEKQKIGQVD